MLNNSCFGRLLQGQCCQTGLLGLQGESLVLANKCPRAGAFFLLGMVTDPGPDSGTQIRDANKYRRAQNLLGVGLGALNPPWSWEFSLHWWV